MVELGSGTDIGFACQANSAEPLCQLAIRPATGATGSHSSSSVISGQTTPSRNSRGNLTLEFLGNQYFLFKEDASAAKPLGVDHLGHPFLRPSLDRSLELWNVSTRPEKGSYRFYGADENKSNPQQIQCITLSELIGITIVCAGRVIYAIHGHKNHHSSAIDTYLSLSPSAQKVALLLYFPLNPGSETIDEVWVRESLPFPERNRTIMLRTSQRTQIFGPNDQDQRCHYFPLAYGLATSLLYHVPASGNPISVFGAVSTSPSLPTALEPNAVFNGGGTPSMYRSQASLKDVAHIEAYIHVLEGNRCSGILVKHEDGREEALGQRRFGLSNVQTISISRPSQIHYKPFQTSNGHWHLKLIFSTLDNPNIVDTDKGWITQVMTGIAVWSFDWRNEQLQFPSLY
ncbi:hypothetical protein B7494_g8213 [Chlorociboria aeruginascens]|nr:hypothetical protein B7494_g8213 [Chlorociboria aeruginascens]